MNDNQFILDGITYQIQFNELGERGGCCQLDGSDMVECCDCAMQKACPADGDDE
jgi:hypothetical protein